jgi:hypothetical protein
MSWRRTAAAQNVLSALPRSQHLNYLLQRHVTKRLPAGLDELELQLDEALRHVSAYERVTGRAPGVARAYAFGAGWELAGPLSMWALGVDDQTVVDLQPVLRWELVSHSVCLLEEHHEALQARLGRALRRPSRTPVESLSALRKRFGIDYRAPFDARDTGLPESTFDLVTSTFTLEHVPPEDVAAILRESARLLTPSGVASHCVDLHDHFAHRDASVSVYNFLRYSDRRWGLVNSALHYQNRLRSRDYLELFSGAGLQIREADEQRPDRERLRTLADVPLATRFAADYTRDELEIVLLRAIAAVA